MTSLGKIEKKLDKNIDASVIVDDHNNIVLQEPKILKSLRNVKNIGVIPTTEMELEEGSLTLLFFKDKKDEYAEEIEEAISKVNKELSINIEVDYKKRAD